MSSNGTASTLLSSFTPPPSPSPSPSQQTEAASSPPLPSVTPSAVPTQGPSSAPPSPSNQPSSADPPSSAAPPASPTPTPTPAPAPSSNPPPASSSPAPVPASSRPASSAPAPASSAPPPNTTRVVTASSVPPVTEVQTSIIIVTPSQSIPGQTPSVIVITSIITPSNDATRPTTSVGSNVASASPTDATKLQGSGKEESSGLSTGGKTAIAVVIPVVAVALLVLGAILFWRRRKQRKDNEDERRKEVEEYGYNPNHDPTLPAVGMTAEMAEDSSGYRGWGNTQTSSNRKASTTLTSGMTYSDSNSNPGGYASPNSPTHGTYSDGASNDPLVNGRRETMDSDGIAALGAAPTANNATGVHRGPSNASSSYSAANHSDNSGEYPGMPTNNTQEYYDQGYYQDGPYGGNNAYGGGQQPIIRDVSARRNTRIENPTVFPQQGNSGVSTNF